MRRKSLDGIRADWQLSAMRFTPVVLVSFVLAVGCSSAHEMGVDAAIDAGIDSGRPFGDPDSGGPRDASPILVFDTNPPDSAIPMPPPGVTVCGAQVCDAGQICCLLTLDCVDAGDPSACTIPAGTTDPMACVSNADCAADQICEVNDIFTAMQVAGPACGGTVGHCVMQRPPSDCGGFGQGVCGCDGRTYADPCAASRAGVRVSWMFPCGVDATASSIYACDADHTFCTPGRHCDVAAGRCLPDVPTVACGIDAQCPDGYSCCGIVGLCMPTSCPDCCAVPPPGSTFPCRTNADCAPLDAQGFVGFYCGIGNGCDTLGGCTYSGDPCGGQLAPVCGCDGTSYSNACWAGQAHVRIAHDGMCP